MWPYPYKVYRNHMGRPFKNPVKLCLQVNVSVLNELQSEKTQNFTQYIIAGMNIFTFRTLTVQKYFVNIWIQHGHHRT